MKNRRMCLAGMPLLCLLAAGCPGNKESGDAKPGTGAPSVVTLTPESEAAAGIRNEKAGFRRPDVSVHAKGVVVFDPRRFVRIAAKAAGIVESVSAFEGDRVHQGQELLSLYCPEFLTAQAEFLQIRERLAAVETAGDSSRTESLAKLLASAEERLRFMGMAPDLIRGLAAEGRMRPLLSLLAPFDASVVEAKVLAGTPVQPSSELFALADPRALWVIAQIQEKSLADVRAGCRAEVRVDAYPGETFMGRLATVGDALDEATRTVKARVELNNRAGKLKPGMYADVALERRLDAAMLCVPERAVRAVDGRNVVFVAYGQGAYGTRRVTAGRTFSGYTEILSGLKPGEAVATDGSFALKSELLKGSMEGE